MASAGGPSSPTGALALRPDSSASTALDEADIVKRLSALTYGKIQFVLKVKLGMRIIYDVSRHVHVAGTSWPQRRLSWTVSEVTLWQPAGQSLLPNRTRNRRVPARLMGIE